MGIRARIEPALAATADRLSPGSGAEAVRHAKNDLMTIDGSSDNFDRRYAGEDVRIAAPAVFETKHPDGDPVTFGKKHEGLLVVFADSLVYVRGMAFGAREVKSVKAADVTLEAITTVLDGVEVPGLRIAGRFGKPKFAVAITLATATASPEAAAVRDEIIAALTH